MTIENVDEILCRLIDGHQVNDKDRVDLITHVYQRICKGEQGDDLPIAMEELGCNYDKACEAVFTGKTAEALSLLQSALMTKEQFLQLQRELEGLELAGAKGEDTGLTEKRVVEIDNLLENSPWTLCPDRGCIAKSDL